MTTSPLNLQKIHSHHTLKASKAILLSTLSQYTISSISSLLTIFWLLPTTPIPLAILQALGSNIPLSLLALIPTLRYRPHLTHPPVYLLLLSLFPISLPLLLPHTPSPQTHPFTSFIPLGILLLSCGLTYLSLYLNFKNHHAALTKLHFLYQPPTPDLLTHLETTLSNLKTTNPALFTQYTDQLLSILKTREPSHTEIELLVHNYSASNPASKNLH